MTDWYKRSGVGIGLRMAGLAILTSAWMGASLLNTLWSAHPGEDMTVGEFLLSGLVFLGVSLGMAFTIWGAALFEEVEISVRWIQRP